MIGKTRNVKSTIVAMVLIFFSCGIVNASAEMVDDFPNSISGAPIITSSVEGILEYYGDFDFFKFIPSYNGTYNFKADSCFDTTGTLYDASGTPLITVDTSYNTDMNFRIDYILTANSIYYISINASQDCGENKPYIINIKKTSPFPNPYANFYFVYPFSDKSYTTLYQGFLGYDGNHYGLDFNVPEGTIIQSVTGGVVIYAGGVIYEGYDLNSTTPHPSMGWFVTVKHNVTDPYGSNNLIARYLHMSDIPRVRTGWNTGWGSDLGYVGNTGRSTAPHLHLDFNFNEKYWGGSDGCNVANCIDPALFWPNELGQYIAGDPAMETTRISEPEYEDDFVKSKYIDASLIDYVGKAKFNQWLENISYSDANVTSLVADLNISPKKFSEIVSTYNLQSVYNTSEIISAAQKRVAIK